jgi:hypothetical protein
MVDLKLVHEMRLQGIGWQEITDTVPFASDNTRKLYSGYLIGVEDNEDNTIIKNAKTLQSIRLKRKELGIERSINNEQIRDITLHQTFTHQVVDAIKNKYEQFNVVNTKPLSSSKAHIFTVGDFHFNGDLSQLEILKRATGEIIKVIEEKELDTIYLIEGGDVIEGASLRTSQLMSVKSGMVSQVITVADAYIKMISLISGGQHHIT